jgi:two-component system, OmpR family, sensor kinase
MHLPSRLTLQIYLVSVVQLAVVAGAIALIGWLTFRQRGFGERHGEAAFIVQTVAQHWREPEHMRAEAERVRRTTKGKLSIYAANGSLLVSNVTPALGPRAPGGPPPQADRRGPPGRPPLLHIELGGHGAEPAYGLFVPGRRPPPPPPLLWALLAAMVSAAVAAVLLARSFARPLHALTEAARSFGGGDLSARAGLKRRDEFGELAQAFDEMAQRVAQLVRSQQELLADVSHELRTPLSRIRVALDLAAEGDADMARSALSEISADLAELERLIADVLQTARLDLAAGRADRGAPPLQREPLALAELLERSTARFRSAHPGRSLIEQLPAELPVLFGDAALLRRALDNLLDNAAAYSEVDQPVTLRVAGEPEALRIEIEDRGMGIAPEHLPHIGRPFYRTDRSRARRTGGLGLGISLSRRIVEAHGGTLSLESRVDVGTCACIRLPRDSWRQVAKLLLATP